MKDIIVKYLDKYNKKIRKFSGSYILKEINEELFPALKVVNQGEKIYYDSEKKRVSLLEFLIDNDNRNCMNIFLLGEGGMGKTVSMLSTTETLSAFSDNKFWTIYIPLYLLNDIENDRIELLKKYMFDEIWQSDSETYNYFTRNCNTNNTVIFLLDGFNELKLSIRTKVAKEIAHLINQNIGKVVISSRDKKLIELPSFIHYEDEIEILEIQPLKEEQIRRYLNICNLDYPKNNRLIDVLSNPLMLTLYANCSVYSDREKGIFNQLLWYHSPENAGQIIWNFLQTQILKLWIGAENIVSAIDIYVAVLFVSAFIGYKMETSQKFSVTITLLNNWIKDFKTESNLLLNIVNDLCANGLDQVIFDGRASDWKMEEKEILEILKNQLCIFVRFYEKSSKIKNDTVYSPQEYKIEFMKVTHHKFRDCYAAIYRKNLLLKDNWHSDEAWSNVISPSVLDFCADLFTEDELKMVLNKIRGIEFESNNEVITNILNICKIVFKNDFSKLDFSELDLRKVYLGKTKINFHTKFESATVSYNTFLPEGHKGKVYAISVLKNCNFSVSGGEDKSIILWNLVTGKQEGKFGKTGNIICIDSCLRFDENKKKCDFVLIGNKQGKICEINIQKESEICLLKLNCKIVGVAYNPINPEKFALITEKELLIYDITMKKICNRIISEKKICSGVYSSDATKFILGLENGEIKGWIVDEKKIFISYKRHTLPVTVMAISYSGKYLVSGSNERKLIICEIYENTKNHAFEESLIKEIKCDENIQCIKFFPCSNKENCDSFIWSTNGTAAAKNLIMKYNICNDTEQILSYHKHLIHDLDFTLDGSKYVTASYDTTVKCWDIDTELCVGVMQGFSSWIRSIAFSPDGKKCVLGSYDNSLKIWDVDNSRCCKTLKGHEHWVRDLEYISNGKNFLSVSYDQTLRIWDGDEPYQCKNVLKKHTKGISGVSCSANGEYCVTASYDRTAILWNLNEKDINRNHIVLNGHQERVRDVAYSPNKDICVTASYDKTLIVWNCNWNLQEDRIIKVLKGHEDYVRCLTFTPNGQYCISGSYDKTFIVWNADKWTIKYQSKQFDEWIRCLACSPDGKNLLIGCDNGIVYIWDINKNIELGQLRGHENWIGKVKYFPNGKNCLSCSDDNSVKIWTMEKGENQYKCKNTYQILPYLDLVDCDFRKTIFAEDTGPLKSILFENGALINKDKE